MSGHAVTTGNRPRIAVCFDLYEPFHLLKEGNLILGLAESGADAHLVTTAKPAMDGHSSPFPVHLASREELDTEPFWRRLDVDVVIAYTFLNWRYTPLLRAIRAAGKPLVVRADSDGHIGYPVHPRRLYLDPTWTRDGAVNLARRVAWRVAPRRMAGRRLDHLSIPHRIFIESPHAFAVLAAFVCHWQRPDLLHRVACIPMTISDAFVQAPLVEKTRQLVAIGRWRDERQKNTAVVARVLESFLSARTDYRAVVIGEGGELVRRHLRSGTDVGDRLLVTGRMSQQEMLAHVAPSRTLFMPSNWEGFALAAGEAVCLGCSLSGTPLGALRWLTAGGEFGTLSESFTEAAILGALHVEASRWDRGERDPNAIASTWRPRINRRAVGARLLELCTEAHAESGRDTPLRMARHDARSSEGAG